MTDIAPAEADHHHEEHDMAKGQRKSNKEIRKPKKEGPAKTNAANPSQKNNVAGVFKT